MQAWREQLKHFQDMKWSEIIEGRKQDILQWVRGNPQIQEAPPEHDTGTPSTTPARFSFNTALLNPHFQDLSKDPLTLPFIEFSAIGLLRAPSRITTPKDLSLFIQRLLNKLGREYQDIPFIIAMGWRYYLFGNTNGNIWTLTELDYALLDGRQLRFTEKAFLLGYDLQHYPIYQHIIEKKAHTHFSTQAQQITQIKKIINSTFYIQELLRQAEGLEISFSGIFGLGAACFNYVNGATYDNMYRAITLLSDAEIDFAHRFKDEVSEFLQILARFKQLSTMTRAQVTAPPSPPGIYSPTNSFQVGHAAGFITRNIYDANGQWDIDVFSQFSADLPKHIDMLTTLINANNSSVIQHAPNINPAQLRSLQKEATKLLNTLKNTKKNANRSKLNPLYQMYQIINYAFLIRQIIVLLSTTLTQVGQLNEAYQESLRDILSTLQEDCFSLLVNYADHAEIELILDPGTLSRPVVKTINSINDYLADHIKSLANFSFLGEELLTIENSNFLAKRVAAIQSMFQESQQAQQQVLWAQEALHLFLEELATTDPSVLVLRTHYAWLAPYVQKIDPKLNRPISVELTKTQGICNLDGNTVRALRCQLSAYLTKLQNTEVLRAQQCQAVLASIPQHTHLQLFPYSARTGCDIALKIVKDTPLDGLALPKKHPILIQHRVKSENSYVFYGNTDGTKWGFTSIAAAFIHPDILQCFPNLSRNLTDVDQNVFHILSYRTKYESLYKQMILRKAHTHYHSKFSSLESEVLGDKPESLTTVVCKPIDWLQKKWQGQTALSETTTAQADAVVEPVLTITKANQYHDYYAVLEELSVEQTLKLSGWYQQKIANYNEAVEMLDRFKELINQHFPRTEILFSERSALQKQCQYLYHSLRPYLISIRNFPDFDHSMVQALSVPTAGRKTRPHISCNTFNRILREFSLERARELIAGWQDRANQLAAHARNTLSTKNEQELLTRRGSFTALPRDGYLLKTTEISTKIRELHNSLKEWIPILNTRIQRELQTASRAGVAPYPEIMDLKEQLSHPPFILFFKRIFNAVHHLEHLAIELERIRTGDTEEIKKETIQLILDNSRSHGKALFDISIQLRDDRVLSELCQDAYQQYSEIIHKISNLVKPYTTDVKKVHPKTEGVNLPGLWYSMNAFYTFPAHLLSITGQGYHNLGYGMRLINDINEDVVAPTRQTLTLIQHGNHYYIYSNGTGEGWALRNLPHSLIAPLKIDFSQNYLGYDHRCQPLYDYLIQHEYHFTHLNELQILAKRATQNIEQIIQDSNHYFKLFFFDAPMIYQLNQRLQAQLPIFTRTAQEIAMSHLDILQTDYFAPLSVRADTKEHEWGLLAGTLTEPLEAIKNEWFQGLIFPLKKTFRKKAEFCTNDIVLTTRIVAEEQRLAELSTVNGIQSAEIAVVYKFANNLKRFVDNQSAFEKLLYPTPVSSDLVDYYTTNIFPKLVTHRNTFIPQWLTIILQGLSRDNLQAIQAQVGAYYTRLARFSLLHNARDRQLSEALPIFLTCLDILLSGNNVEAMEEISPKLIEYRAAHKPDPNTPPQARQTESTMAADMLTCLEELIASNMSEAIPRKLSTFYLKQIVPRLQQHSKSCVPDWLKEINTELNLDTLSAVLEQTQTYSAHLHGAVATQALYKGLSTEKLAYLRAKLETHRASSMQQYRQSFAKHHLHTYINRLPYQASGLMHSKIHREYHRELKAYLIQQETELLQHAMDQEDIDTGLNGLLQTKITEFKKCYFERFQRFDRLQTAINEFKDYLMRDHHLPTRLRTAKMDCLNSLEDIIHQNRGELAVEAMLNGRSQLLRLFIETNKDALLEQHPQFNNVLDWLIDCVMSLFVALGLYTPECQKRYADLVNADNPQQNLPPGWTSFLTFRPAPSTPPRGTVILTTPSATPAR